MEDAIITLNKINCSLRRNERKAALSFRRRGGFSFAPYKTNHSNIAPNRRLSLICYILDLACGRWNFFRSFLSFIYVLTTTYTTRSDSTGSFWSNSINSPHAWRCTYTLCCTCSKPAIRKTLRKAFLEDRNRSGMSNVTRCHRPSHVCEAFCFCSSATALSICDLPCSERHTMSSPLRENMRTSPFCSSLESARFVC